MKRAQNANNEIEQKLKLDHSIFALTTICSVYILIVDNKRKTFWGPTCNLHLKTRLFWMAAMTHFRKRVDATLRPETR